MAEHKKHFERNFKELTARLKKAASGAAWKKRLLRFPGDQESRGRAYYVPLTERQSFLAFKRELKELLQRVQQVWWKGASRPASLKAQPLILIEPRHIAIARSAAHKTEFVSLGAARKLMAECGIQKAIPASYTGFSRRWPSGYGYRLVYMRLKNGIEQRHTVQLPSMLVVVCDEDDAPTIEFVKKKLSKRGRPPAKRFVSLGKSGLYGIRRSR